MIIGISGRLGSGKDLVGKIIQRHFAEIKQQKMVTKEPQRSEEKLLVEPEWEIKKFAGKLKDTVCLLIGCSRKDLEDRDFKEAPLGPDWDSWVNGGNLLAYNDYKENTFKIPPPSNTKQIMTPRLLLQLLGTDCGRNIIHPDIWVNALMSGYQRSFGKDGLESTYPNWIITDMRFPNEMRSIKDKGGITIRVNRPQTRIEGSDLHESETALDGIEHDFVLENDKDIKNLIFCTTDLLLSENLLTFIKTNK